MFDGTRREASGILTRLIFGRAERRERERADFIAKFDAYTAAMTAWAIALGSVKSNAPRSKLGGALDQIVAKWDLLSTDAQDEAISRLLYPGQHRRNEAMLREWIDTQTRLGTIAPRKIRDAMQATSTLLIAWSNDTTANRTDEWLKARKSLQVAADHHLASRTSRMMRAMKHPCR